MGLCRITQLGYPLPLLLLKYLVFVLFVIKDRLDRENKQDIKYYKKSDVYAFAVIMVRYFCIYSSLKYCTENKLGRK